MSMYWGTTILCELIGVPLVEERLKAREQELELEGAENRNNNTVDRPIAQQRVNEASRIVKNPDATIKLDYLRGFMRNRNSGLSQPIQPTILQSKPLMQSTERPTYHQKAYNNNTQGTHLNSVKDFIKENESKAQIIRLNAYNNSRVNPHLDRPTNQVRINPTPDQPDMYRASVQTIESINDYIDVSRFQENPSNPLNLKYQELNPRRANI